MNHLSWCRINQQFVHFHWHNSKYVELLISWLWQTEWELQTNFVRETLPLSHEVQKGPSCFLKAFSLRIHTASESRISTAINSSQASLQLDSNFTFWTSLYSLSWVQELLKKKGKKQVWGVFLLQTLSHNNRKDHSLEVLSECMKNLYWEGQDAQRSCVVFGYLHLWR